VADFLDEGDLGKAYDARLVRRIWTFVRPYRAVFWAALLLSPLHQVFSLVQPYLVKVGIDSYVSTRDLDGLRWVGLIFVAAIAGEFVAFYTQQYLTMVVAQRSLADLRVALFAHLQRLPMRFFDRTPVGRIVSRVTSDVDVLNEMFAAGAMTIVLDLVKLAGIVAFMLWIEWQLALVSLALLPVMVLAVDFFRRMARRTYREIRARVAVINGFLQEAISGMAVVQLSAREARAADEFQALNASHRDATHLSNRLESALFSIVESVSTVSIALMLWRGGVLHTRDAMEIGTVVAFIQYIQQFFVPIRDFSAKYAIMQSAMTAAERIFGLLDVEPEPAPSVPRMPAQRRGAIAFDHVWFAYREEDWVLRDVCFRVEPGEHVAIVGPTGSGKTTIIKLLDRLYDVQQGAVRVDGLDVREWDLATLRRQSAVVLQDVFLFQRSFADNVSLGTPGVDRTTVEMAGRHVNAATFVVRRGGWDAILQERGSNLSTGQRQLVAFARALAHDPAILVLDEATSSVDPQTEALIQDALETLLRGRTAVVVAHRLSTIERADRILVLHKGEIREHGTHAELLARGGLYARLHALQYAPGNAAAS
jgi:ATP-binding cassette subfamily B multidrug efflux pump